MDPQQLLPRLRTLASSFTSAQLATLALTFVIVVSVIAGSTYWMNKPEYELLFADMDPETAGQIVTKLKTQKVAYQLDPGGRGIRVPSDRVDELRIDLTATGLPASGRSPSTLPATRLLMPDTVDVGSVRCPRSFSTTEAFAGRDSPKSESLPMAMCTRALATSEIVLMVRAISPSRARR